MNINAPDTQPSIFTSLSEETVVSAVHFLAERDADLAKILQRLGPPPMWAREPGFSTLLHIILEQQVSLASAKAAYDRLLAIASPLTPERFLELDDGTLKGVGFSRQKMGYGRHLAQSILTGHLDLAALSTRDDAAVRAELTRIKGIGSWSADIYLLLVLRRPDIWPIGDRALAVAVQKIKGLATCPTPVELEAVGAAWQPWRAVAARLLWHYYLSGGATGKLSIR